MPPPSIRMQVVDDVAAADDQNSFFAQWSESLTDFIVKRRGLSLINAQLHNRNVCLRIYMTQDCPRAMVQTPAFVKSHQQRRKQLLYTARQVGIARCWILHLIQFSRKAAEVVNRPWGRANRHRGVLNVPVSGYTEDRLRSRQCFSDCSPPLRI